MKRNNLTTAVIAGIAGVAGVASISQAVHLNNDGLGQVLIYPYYTVNNGYNTIITVVNTTDQAKAVKVRFLEGKNTREVLDFNLYLSRYDVWTSALVREGTDVKLKTADTSCTSPNNIDGRLFQPFAYAGDPVGEDGVRKFEGHFEIIEMGPVVDPAVAAAVTHNAGVPPNCAILDTNWVVGSGAWDTNPAAANAVLDNPTGGLFGTASLINVAEGVDVGYDAVALDDFRDTPLHTSPGSLLPSLGSASPASSIVVQGGTVFTSDWTAQNPFNSVSSVFMHDRIYNEYTIESAINADTEWVITFPTKNAYVNNAPAPAEAPFTNNFGENGSCEPVGARHWDREEGEPTGGTVPISPTPPDQPGPAFCWEANILSFTSDASPSGTSAILGSNHNLWFTVANGFEAGWAELSFNNPANVLTSNAGNAPANQFTGLPVTGFAVQKYVNGTLGGGSTLANYAGLFQHKYRTNVTSL